MGWQWNNDTDSWVNESSDANYRSREPAPHSLTPAPAYAPQQAYAPAMDYAMPDYSALFARMAANDAKYAADLAEQQEQARRDAAMQEMKGLFGLKMDAAQEATKNINTQIAQEESHAALMGLDYGVTEEDKLTRINDVFAGLWSEANESQYAQLEGEWGVQKSHVWDSGIVRGTEQADVGGMKGDTSTSAGGKVAAKPQQMGTFLTEEDDVLGGSTILGGA